MSMLLLSLKHSGHSNLTTIYNLILLTMVFTSWSFFIRSSIVISRFHGHYVSFGNISCSFYPVLWNFNLLFEPILKCRSTTYKHSDCNKYIKSSVTKTKIALRFKLDIYPPFIEANPSKPRMVRGYILRGHDLSYNVPRIPEVWLPLTYSLRFLEYAVT